MSPIHHAYRLLILTGLILSPGPGTCQNNRISRIVPDSLKKVVLMQPTGEMVSDLPEMILIPDTTRNYQVVRAHIDDSFVTDFLDVYFLTQVYLKNKNKLDQIDPAYIALTNNQGGFAKFGFALKCGDHHLIKPKTAYVDITESQATAAAGTLMSFTQLYPHEMGHVLFRMVSPKDSVNNNSKSVNLHFFSIVTDYATAFNEGFAEHIENVSRNFEQNASIRDGIYKDIEAIGQSMQPYRHGFKWDFRAPFRLGYYKATMLFWYQKFEDYKRHVRAFNGDARYKSTVLSLSNPEDEITFRNSGVELDKESPRNYVQLLATEGVVSSFLTHLSTGELAHNYHEPSFYRQFLLDSTAISRPPRELFSPMQNQFLKYIHVIHNYVVLNNSPNAQFTDFVHGYITAFPSEASAVKKLFETVLGLPFKREVPFPLWILVKEHPHRLLVFDPYDAITVPLYTFDLNAAEVEDLRTLEGISRTDAAKIVTYRESHGFFTGFGQLEDVPDLSREAVGKIQSATLDEAYLEQKLKGFEPRLSLQELIATPLKHLLFRAGLYFILLFVMIQTLIRKYRVSSRKTALLFLKYFFLWLVLIASGLMAVLLEAGKAPLYWLGLSAISIALVFWFYRRSQVKRQRSLIYLGSMCLLILISIL